MKKLYDTIKPVNRGHLRDRHNDCGLHNTKGLNLKITYI